MPEDVIIFSGARHSLTVGAVGCTPLRAMPLTDRKQRAHIGAEELQGANTTGYGTHLRRMGHNECVVFVA